MTKFLAILLIAAGIAMVFAFPFMWMWNYAVVEAVSVARPITFWPAFWLMMFCSSFSSSHAKSSD